MDAYFTSDDVEEVSVTYHFYMNIFYTKHFTDIVKKFIIRYWPSAVTMLIVMDMRFVMSMRL